MKQETIFMVGGQKVLWLLPLFTKESFLYYVRNEEHKEAVVETRKKYEEGDREGVKAMKTPQKQLCVHFAQLYEDGDDISQCVRRSNWFFYDADHLDEQGTSAEAVKQLMLEKKQQTGQVYGDISLSKKGVHAVFPLDTELSYRENILKIDKLFGIKHDQACESYKLGTFIPLEEDIFILEDELFLNVHEVEVKPDADDAERPALGTDNNNNNNVGQHEEEAEEDDVADEFSLEVLDGLCQMSGIRDIDKEGHRHANLILILSKGYWILVSEGQCKAVIRKRMPSFADEPDCKRIIHDAYHKWNRDYQPSKPVMDMVTDINRQRNLAEACFKGQRTIENGQCSTVNVQSTTDNGQSTTVNVQSTTDNGQSTPPPKLPERLPYIAELITKRFPDVFKEMLLVALPSLICAIVSHYRTLHLDNNKLLGSNLFTYIMALSSRGKSNIMTMMDMLYEKTIYPPFYEEIAKEEENTTERDVAGTNKKEKKYLAKKYIAQDASLPSLKNIHKALGPNGILELIYSEGDTLMNMLSSKDDSRSYLRKAWDIDYYSSDRAGDSSVSFHGKVAASMVITSTPDTAQKFFGNLTDGLASRTFPFPFNEPPMLKTPKIKPLSEDEQQKFDEILINAWERNLALGDEVEVLDLPLTHKAAEQFEEQQAELFKNQIIDQTEFDMTLRIPQFILRCGLAFAALEGKETQATADIARWFGETGSYYKRKLFYKILKNDQLKQKGFLEGSYNPHRGYYYLFDELSDVFTTKQADEVRKNHGLPVNGATRKWLKDQIDLGYITRIERGQYKKIV